MKETKICDRCGRATKNYITEDSWLICDICQDEGRHSLNKMEQ